MKVTASPTSRSAGYIRPGLLVAIMILCAFVTDARTPNGMVDGLPYILAVLACHWVSSTRSALVAAAAATPTMLLGFVLSPMGSSFWTAAANRVGAMIIVWLTALVISRSARLATITESALMEAKRRLNLTETLADSERHMLSDWLHDEVDLELAAIDLRLSRFSRSPERPANLRSETMVLRRAVRRARDSLQGKGLCLRHRS